MIACESQGGLAELSYPSDGVRAMSLNTLKAVAHRLEPDVSWEVIDKKRRFLRDYYHRSEAASSCAEKAKPGDKTRRLNSVLLEKANRQRAILNRAYFDALRLLRLVAANDPSVASQLERHVATYGADLGIQVVNSGGDSNASS